MIAEHVMVMYAFCRMGVLIEASAEWKKSDFRANPSHLLALPGPFRSPAGDVVLSRQASL